MATIHTLFEKDNQWNGNKLSLESWLDRFEIQLDLLKITDADQKRNAFLAAVGAEGYEMLRNLVTPEKPKTLTYEVLTKKLLDFVKPTPVTMMERYKFSQCSQNNGESVTEFLARVKRAAEFCDYGGHYAEAIKDRFVFGLSDSSTQRVLLAEVDLTMDRAHTKALAREQAGLHTQTLNPNSKTSEISQVDQVTTKKFKTHDHGKSSVYSRNGQNNRNKAANFLCNRCKLPKSKCTISKCVTKCFKCNKLGHSKALCYAKVNNLEFSSDGEHSSMNHIDVFSSKIHDTKPIVDIKIKNVNIPFEFDTGSAITIMSRNTFNNFFTNHCIPLDRSNKVIRVANGGLVHDVYKCSVPVSYKSGESQLLTLYVVDDEFPSLLGRDWIRGLYGEGWLKQVIVEQVHQVRKTRNGMKLQDTQAAKKSVTELAVQEDTGRSKENVTEHFPLNAVTVGRSKENVTEHFPANGTQARVEALKKHPVFKEELGVVKDFPAELKLLPGAEQRFVKISRFRSPEYNIRDQLNKTLNEMEADGRLVSVDSSPIVSPMRIVVKKDGSLRICGDYKRTLNPLLDTKQYPLPTPEDCFYQIRGGQKFSKIDIRAAYNHIMLREEDRYLTTLATPQGLKMWTRLPYGISSALAIFQEDIEKVLRGIDMCMCRVDDILISGVDDSDHLQRLTLVLDTLFQAGFRCRLDKSEFLKEEVVYLGYKVTREGILPCTDKVKTLTEAPYPEDKDKLIAFLGAVNYYSSFIPNMATIIEPLNRLRTKDARWIFGKEEKVAFDELKRLLASSKVLVQYDANLPVKIDTDASKSGIGAVISLVTKEGERPIEFASRTLTKAERNYSQIEKEALAIVWGIKKFHRYVYARNFTLRTDHQPLTFIFGEKKGIPEMGVSRIQRWAILLSSYRYQIEYRRTKDHANADMCSRYPLTTEKDEADLALAEDVFGCDIDEVLDVFANTLMDKELINHTLVSILSRTDKVISKVIRQVQEGCLQVSNLPLEYARRKDELSVEHDCLLWGARVVVPEKLKPGVLELLHATHLGVVNMKALARMYVWWPGITADIEALSKDCEVCKLNQKNPPKTAIHPWIPATEPFERIHIDFCQFEKDNWLVLVDAFSKWVEIINMRKTTDSPATIRELRRIFATFGLPKCVVSDNGPQLVSTEISTFYKKNGIQHIPIPSYKPQCNGLAERMVATFKSSMKKMKAECADVTNNLACWLLTYRNTPHATTKRTPSELMFGRRTRSLLSLLFPQATKPQCKTGNAQVYREFKVDDKVMYKDVHQDKWKPGNVTERVGSKVYLVKGQDGGIRQKHIDQLTSGLAGTNLAKNLIDNHSNISVLPCITTPPAQDKHIKVGPSSVTESCDGPSIEYPLVNDNLTPQVNNGPIVPTPVSPVRTSSRTRNTVQPLNYDVLGGKN